MNPAANPKPVKYGGWMTQHNRFVHETKEREPDVLFIGDSLIENLAGTEVWKKNFERLPCVNFGIGGDRTEHVLWRVQNGEMDSTVPKVIVLLVGTNNVDNTAQQVSDGILAIVDTIKIKQPKAQLIVMGIPPKGEYPNKYRDQIAEINNIVADQLKDVSNYTFLATEPALFINPDGTISNMDMPDYLHLTDRGYVKLCAPLLDLLPSLLQTFDTVENTSQESD